MLCNRTAKLQPRMGEICHFEILREFLLTAFSSCKAIIFLNDNMIYKSQLNFILLMWTDSKWNVLSQNIKFSQELTKWGIKSNIFCSQACQNLGLCWHICRWMLVFFRVLGSAWFLTPHTFSGWHQPLQKLQLFLLPQWLPYPHPSHLSWVPGPCVYAPEKLPSYPTDSSTSNSLLFLKPWFFSLNPSTTVMLPSVETSKIQFLLSRSL